MNNANDVAANIPATNNSTTTIPAELWPKITDVSTLSLFCQEYPDYANAAVSRVLNENTEFSRIIADIEQLQIFCKSFSPIEAKQALTNIVDYDADFERIVRDDKSLEKFSQLFLSMAKI